jgi:hypothetical protein
MFFFVLAFDWDAEPSKPTRLPVYPAPAAAAMREGCAG